MLSSRKIILGVCGGIAAYKTAELIRLLKKAGTDVQVLMTADAGRFVTPLTLGTLSEREVLSEIFPANEDGSWTKHIGLGLWADAFVVAPATAQTIAKLANGVADSMLTATALAARCPILVFPAMDHDMYIHPATQNNLETLTDFGYNVYETGYGELASGLVGHGRLLEPSEIVDALDKLLEEQARAKSGELAGKHVLVTAGPTREMIDPVRFLSNRSTGTMGFEIARDAAERGADVTLVSGPTSLSTPSNVRRIDVVSAADMHAAVMSNAGADIVVMAAAVADFAPTTVSPEKVKKESANALNEIALSRTVDILRALGEQKRRGQFLVGFALETTDGESNAQRKLQEKNLDLIVLNNPNEEGAGFGTTTNHVTLYHRDGRSDALPMLDKASVARLILDALQNSVSADS